MSQTTYTLLILFAISDIGVALVGACLLWKIRKQVPLVKYIGILLSATVVNRICQVVSGSNIPAPWVTANGYCDDDVWPCCADIWQFGCWCST